MSNTTTSTTTNAKPSAIPTAKVFAGYVDELMAAGSAIEKVAAKIALAATRQAAHRSSLTYLNAACAAFRACHLTCMPQLMPMQPTRAVPHTMAIWGRVPSSIMALL